MEGNNSEVKDNELKKAETKAMIEAISVVVVIAILFIYFMYFHKSTTPEENATNETNVTEENQTSTNETEVNETNSTIPDTNETEENQTTPEENQTIEMKELIVDFTEPCLEDLDKKTEGYKKYSIIVNKLKINNEPVQFIYDYDESKPSTVVFINNKVVSQRIDKERIYKMCYYNDNLIISYEMKDGYVNDIVGTYNKLKANFDGLYTYSEDNNSLHIKYASFVNVKDRIAYYYEDEVNLSTFETKNLIKKEYACDNIEKDENITEEEKNLVLKACLGATNNK